MNWISRNIDEIEQDRGLQLFGLAMALANVVTFFYWKVDFPLLEVLQSSEIPVCWPFFENCQIARVFSDGLLSALLWGYLAASLAAVGAFSSSRFARVGYWILFALLFYRGFFLFQDYRLRLNQHYMMYWTMAAFLFVPGKRNALRYLVVLFYFWAGTIKLNPEWFSGAALYGKKPWLVPRSLVPASCVYVVIMEMLLVFGVFSRRPWLFWATLAQLALFHLTSFSIVGFYYPLLMYTILTIFVVERHTPPPLREATESPSLARSRTIALGVLLGGFICVQFVPYAFPGDTAMTGEGRYLALHMFDAPLDCRATAVFESSGRQRPPMPLRARYTPRRIHCDPIVAWSIARHICRSRKDDPNFTDMRVQLRARRSGGNEWYSLLDIPQFCRQYPGYRIFGHNDWIRFERERTVERRTDKPAQGIPGGRPEQSGDESGSGGEAFLPLRRMDRGQAPP